jgi:AcrR family transcriptional regulator
MASPTRPRGREAVRAALISAAKELFRDRTPSSVTVREIARTAGVNQGLVHEYFGSKGGLIQETLESLTVDVAAVSTRAARGEIAPSQLLDLLTAEPTYVRLIASVLLEEGVIDLPHDLSPVRPLVEAFDRGAGPDAQLDARMLTGSFIALVCGWVLFREYIETATDLQIESTHEQHLELDKLIRAMASWNRGELILAE